MIPVESLEFSWFFIFVVLITGYAILDGFDLGVGMLHLFAKKDEERRVMLNSIGPVWDGNEVWLVTAGGALFAGFPEIYATMLSAFYEPFMVLLAGLIFRAVAIEFRSKETMAWWRWSWDIAFCVASIIIPFMLGIMLANLIHGIKMDVAGEYMGTLEDLLHPYAFLMGFFVCTLFLMHGSIYLLMKTEGELHDKMRERAQDSMIIFIITYTVVTMATLIYEPHMINAFRERPIFFLVAILNVLAVANIPREIVKGRDHRAFLSSCLNMICLFTLYAIGTYPNVIRDILDPENLSITIYNGASSPATLRILFIFALIGMPLVLSYTTVIYYIFRGKVKMDKHSY